MVSQLKIFQVHNVKFDCIEILGPMHWNRPVQTVWEHLRHMGLYLYMRGAVQVGLTTILWAKTNISMYPCWIYDLCWCLCLKPYPWHAHFQQHNQAIRNLIFTDPTLICKSIQSSFLNSTFLDPYIHLAAQSFIPNFNPQLQFPSYSPTNTMLNSTKIIYANSFWNDENMNKLIWSLQGITLKNSWENPNNLTPWKLTPSQSHSGQVRPNQLPLAESVRICWNLEEAEI